MLDLLTNAAVVDDAIRFVSSNQKGCQQQILSEEEKEKGKAHCSTIKYSSLHE